MYKYFYINDGKVIKCQQGTSLFSSKQLESIYNKVKEASKTASDAYKSFSDSPWNLAFDVINTGLYAAAPVTGGATLPIAMAMSAGQGLAAANNIANEGVNVNNTLDVVGGLLAAPAEKAAKSIMKTVGKNTKRVKNAKLFKTTKDSYKIGNIELGKTHSSLWDLSKSSKKYWPYFTYYLAQPAVNIGQIGNDVKDSYLNYILPWTDFNKEISQEVENETNSRLNGNTQNN